MVKIRVFYNDNRELAEIVSLLSPRLNYCRTFPEEEPKRAYLGIETENLLDDQSNIGANESLTLPGDTPENTEGDINND